MSRDRDRNLEQALRHELRAAGTSGNDSHVDAETLAAWSDGGLDSAAMLSVESHVSSCARCQAIAGAMARSAPATIAAAPERGFKYWFFAPLAAGIAAVGLWAIVPERPQSNDAIDQARPGAVAVEQPPAPPPAAALPKASSPTAPVSADTARANAARQERAPLATTETRQQAADQLARADAQPAEKEAQIPAAGSREAGRNAVAAAAPAAPAFQDPALQKTLQAGFVPLEIISPDQNHRWRVVPTGIEFSMDRGSTWNPVRAARDEVITGGTAVSGTILWLIGKAGVVLVTVDGMTFATVHLPVRVDVTSISATDARSATVTTADGRTFRTTDSGRNWQES